MTTIKANGLDLHYTEQGEGDPLVLLAGGMHGGDSWAPLLPALSAGRRVITVDLQAHGGTADIDRPLRAEHLADDIAAFLDALGIEQADVLGYSLGGKTALRLAIQHPAKVRRLVLVSVAFARAGNFPEVIEAMNGLTAEVAPMMQQSPVYHAYAAIAPRPEDWPVLVGKLGDAVREDFDWEAEVAALSMPVQLVFADADSIRPDHIATFYALLGGGRRDARFDGALRPANRLAIIPGRSHYDVFESPILAALAIDFLDAERLVPEPLMPV